MEAQLLSELLKQKRFEQLKASLRYTGLSSIFVGLTTLAGGILGGPIGIAAGATLGGVISAVHGYNEEYKPVSYILLHEITPEQRARLINLIMQEMKKKSIFSIQGVITAMQANESLAQLLVATVVGFLTSDLGYTILQ